MIRLAFFCRAAVLFHAFAAAGAQAGFTVEQALQAPYAVSLSASPVGGQFAWVEVEEGRHNLWVGGDGVAARALTRYSEDDGQDLREMAWFPDGKALAYTRGPEKGADGRPANAAHRQPPPETEVWIARLTPAHATPLLAGEGHSALPLPDGRHLLLIRGGQVWEADLPRVERPAGGHGFDARQLVFDRGSATQLALSPDGGLLAFISRRDHNHSFLALFDLKRGRLSFPAPSTGNDSAPAWSRDGRRLAWLRSPWTQAAEFAVNRASGNPWTIEVLDVASGAVRAAYTPEAGKPGSVLPHMSTAAPEVLWAEALPGYGAGPALIFASEADGWVHLYGLPVDALPGAKPLLLTPLPGEVETPVLSPDRSFLLYSSQGPPGTCREAMACARNLALPESADRRSVWKLDLAGSLPGPGGGSFPLPLTPPSEIAALPAIAGDGTAAALVSDARYPMQPARLSAQPAAADAMDVVAPAKPLYPARYGSKLSNSRANSVVTPLQVLFPSADGQFTLHGQLFPPPAAGGEARSRHPAVLFFHGGPRRQMLLGYPAMEYYAHAYALNQYLASRGFLVLSVNYRGGIGYGMDFRETAHTGADGAAEYSDVLGAAAYLRSRPDVDPARIGLWGGSYGGYLTALALARNSDLFAAGVDFHGVHDWILEDNRSDWLRGTAAEQEKIAARAHQSSPMADIDKWRSPVLLIHGDNDASVAYAQTPVLADALRERGVPVQELIFPDEIHEFLLYRDWLAAYRATADFLERKLRP